MFDASDDWTADIPPFGDEQPTADADTDEQAGPAGAELPEPTPAVDIPSVDVAGVLSNPSPPPDFAWAGRVPAGHVTLLSGHGGSGKSTLGLQLAVAVAAGRPLLGQETTKGRALVFSAEDAAPLLRHRLAAICREMDIAPPVLAENLTVLDASAEPVLHRELVEFGTRTLTATPIFHRLAEIVDEQRPALLVIDNASDSFEGSENDRTQVRAFVRALAKLARETASRPAIVLLTHTPKASVGGRGESYSGSTAWHNSARARLSMTPVKDEPGAVVLSLDKLNVAPMTAPALRLTRTHGGVLVLDESTGRQSDEQDAEPTKAILRVLADFNRRGEHISASQTAHTNAWKLCRPEPGFPKRAYPAAGPLFVAIRQMERDGLIAKASYTDDYRKERQEWLLTAKGRAEIGETAPSAPSAPSYDENAPDAVQPGGAPSAPSYGVGLLREFLAQDVGANSSLGGNPPDDEPGDVGANSDIPTLAETGTRANGTNPRRTDTGAKP